VNPATLDRLLKLNRVPLGDPIAQEIRVEVQQRGTPFRTAFHAVFTRHGIVYRSVRTVDEDGIDLLYGAHAGNGRESRPEQAHGRPRPNEDRREWVDQARAVPILDEINRRGIKLQGKGAEREGPCPICGGKDRFSINTAKGVFNCRKCGGKGGDTIAFVQWLDGVNFDTAIATLAGAKLNKRHEAGKKDRERRLDFKNRVTFDYHDAEGRLVYHRDRLPLLDADGKPLLSDKGKPDKEFMPRLPRAMKYGLNGFVEVPYRLPELIGSINTDRTIEVFVVEGELKADLLREWSYVATNITQGTRDYAEHFRGADVVVLPDNDDTGRKRADAVLQTLNGVAARLRILNLPGLGEGEDIIDWARRGNAKETFEQLVGQARVWSKPDASQTRKRHRSRDIGSSSCGWTKSCRNRSTGCGQIVCHAGHLCCSPGCRTPVRRWSPRTLKRESRGGTSGQMAPVAPRLAASSSCRLKIT
jgi:CHC2 zinc finger